MADHELREKFARLTWQEEKHSLIDEAASIDTLEGWKRRLAERGFALKDIPCVDAIQQKKAAFHSL